MSPGQKSKVGGRILVGLMLVGIVLYILHDIYYQPPRPPGVPAGAEAFQQDKGLWWWASCLEKNDGTSACRLFDERGRLVIAGRFSPKARLYDYDGNGTKVQGRCPTFWKSLSIRRYSSGEITLRDPGCALLAREWVYFPERRTKAAVSEASGRASLAREVPMTDEELKAGENR
jgi:hypothetical protein